MGTIFCVMNALNRENKKESDENRNKKCITDGNQQMIMHHNSDTIEVYELKVVHSETLVCWKFLTDKI